jgi:flagellar hook-associated protein 1 FlgK
VYSTFFGLEIGKRALLTNQLALHTTAHNISNANTPGYSRQLITLAATDPFLPMSNRLQIPTQLGTGVKVDYVSRARDMILEKQIHNETATKGETDVKLDAFTRIEALIHEPSDESVGKALSDFWAGWQELSTHPEDVAVRNSVIGTAQRLTRLMNTKDTELQSLQKSADEDIRSRVDKINQLGEQLRDINVQINQSLGVETQPNDLFDKRDALLGDLAKLTNYEGHVMPNGLYDITISGHTLVQDATFVPLTVVDDPLNSNYAQITWSDDGSIASVTGGEIKGLTDIRDTNIPVYRQALDDLAQGLMNNVNPLQAAGYGLNGAAPTGINFFTGTGSNDIQVNTTLVTTPTLSAAASNPSAPGDGSNALAIALLQQAKPMAAGTQTFGEYYENIVAQVGLDSQHNEMSNDTQKALVQSLEAQRDSVSGVNLDEEMTNMMKFQDGYQAAIRVISTMDSMLDTVINRMGAGR